MKEKKIKRKEKNNEKFIQTNLSLNNIIKLDWIF